MHFFGYLFGLCYYVMVPLSFSLIGVEHTSGKRRYNDSWYSKYNKYNSRWWWRRCGTAVGVAVYGWGSWHQYRCHSILGSLRKDKLKVDKSTKKYGKYPIPRGDWFEFVSCAHYSAEIVVYIGFLLVSGTCDVTLMLMLTWVLSNLSLSSLLSLLFYRRHYGAACHTQWALCPGVL